MKKYQKYSNKKEKPAIRFGLIRMFFDQYLKMSTEHYEKIITTDTFKLYFERLINMANKQLNDDEYLILAYVISQDDLYMKQKED